MLSFQSLSIKLLSAPYTIDISICNMGDDLLIILNGPNPHLGSVALAQPYKRINSADEEVFSPSTSVLSKFKHKDSDFTFLLAKTTSKVLNKTVGVVGGIHIDNAKPETIKEILSLPEKISQEIRKVL